MTSKVYSLVPELSLKLTQVYSHNQQPLPFKLLSLGLNQILFLVMSLLEAPLETTSQRWDLSPYRLLTIRQVIPETHASNVKPKLRVFNYDTRHHCLRL